MSFLASSERAAAVWYQAPLARYGALVPLNLLAVCWSALRQVAQRVAAVVMLTGLFCVTNVHAGTAVPALTSRVTDHAQVLSESARATLGQELAQYEQTTGHQFAFVSISSLDGDALEDFSMRLAEQWRLGDQKRDDGLILLVVKNERKVRIEVGYGLEGAIPDALAARIIRHQIVPAFRRGEFDQGIAAAFATLMKAAAGEAIVVGPKERGVQPHLPRAVFWGIWMAIVLLIVIARGRGGGPGARGGLYPLAGLGLGGLGGRGGFGGGGFGGGGFGGGGGGFGGGG